MLKNTKKQLENNICKTITDRSIFLGKLENFFNTNRFYKLWIIYICINKIKDHKLDLQLNDINQKNNMNKKREHV